VKYGSRVFFVRAEVNDWVDQLVKQHREN